MTDKKQKHFELTCNKHTCNLIFPEFISACSVNYHWLVCNTWCVQVLRSPKEAFAAAMQSWRERFEKCVCLQGDYVEK